MDEIVEYARHRREAIQEELQRIDHFLKLYDEFAAKYASEARPEPTVNIQAATERVTALIEPVLPLVDPEVVPEAPARRKRASGNPKPEEVIRVARMAMLAKGHPMTRRQVLDALQTQGITINGHDPIKVIGTTLWRSKQFVQHEGFGYWPKDAPTPLRRAPVELRGA